jgi:arylsulfatase A-like enzyme
MHRYSVKPWALTCLTAVLLAVQPYASGAPAARPNVIFILTDDMGCGDLSILGGTQGSTPNLDRLAREGTRFSQFYVASPICSASRAAFTTGKYPGLLSVNSFLQTKEGNKICGQRDWLDPKWPTVARTLKQAGYATAHFGKWHLGGGRDVTEAPTPTEYGYDEFHLNCEGIGPRFDDYGSVKGPTLNTADGKFYPRHQFTEYWVDRSIDFIKRTRSGPFYLELWPQDVHTPHTPGEEALTRTDTKEIPKNQHKFRAVLNEYDRQIGRLLDYLREAKLESDTLVIFSSDNGPEPSFDHARTLDHRGMKWSLYEGGIRVPFIVRWPAVIPAGKLNTTALSSIDYFPTLCALTGVTPPTEATFDGINQKPVWLGSEETPNRPLFWEYGRILNAGKQYTGYPYPKGDDKSPNLAVREGDWKLLLNADGTGPELYQLTKDPNEASNVAAGNPDIAARLAAKALEWRKSLP